VKRGREIYERMEQRSAEHVPGQVMRMTGGELVALLDYLDGLTASEFREELTGLVLIAAGKRYLAKARRKAETQARRAVKQVL